MTPHQANVEEGASRERQGIAAELLQVRTALRTDSARFSEWQSGWERQQVSIDSALAQLRQQLLQR